MYLTKEMSFELDFENGEYLTQVECYVNESYLASIRFHSNKKKTSEYFGGKGLKEKGGKINFKAKYNEMILQLETEEDRYYTKYCPKITNVSGRKDKSSEQADKFSGENYQEKVD